MATIEELLSNTAIYLDCDNITQTTVIPSTYDTNGLFDEYGIIHLLWCLSSY